MLDTNKLYTCAKELRSLYTEQMVLTNVSNTLKSLSDQKGIDYDSLEEHYQSNKQKINDVTSSLLTMWDGNHKLNTLMTDGMCFIRYCEQDGTRDVYMTSVVKNRLDIVKRHLNVEGDITKDTLESSFEVLVDWEAWDEFLQEVDKMSREKCKEYVSNSSTMLSLEEAFNKEEEEEIEEEIIQQEAGIHAVERYVERVLGITDPAAIKHESVHRFVEYKEKIENMYRGAEVLYETKGKVFKITEDNVILVYKARDNKIMTLYKKDYGFTEEINRQIIFMQIDVIKNAESKMKDVERAYKKQMSVYYTEEEECKKEIEELQAKLDKANEKLNHVMRCKKSAKSMLEESENGYQEEYDKIFKYCKVVRVEE